MDNRTDIILEGLAITVLGFAVVFLILVIIMLVIKAMAIFSVEKEEKTVSIPEAPKPVEELSQEAGTNDDSELVAVITAAIATLLDTGTSGFIVRSYKKISGGAWNKAGRRDVLDNKI